MAAHGASRPRSGSAAALGRCRSVRTPGPAQVQACNMCGRHARQRQAQEQSVARRGGQRCGIERRQTARTTSGRPARSASSSMRSTLARSAQCECTRSIFTHSSPRTIFARHDPVAANAVALAAHCSARSRSSAVTPAAKGCKYRSTRGCQSTLAEPPAAAKTGIFVGRCVLRRVAASQRATERKDRVAAQFALCSSSSRTTHTGRTHRGRAD